MLRERDGQESRTMVKVKKCRNTSLHSMISYLAFIMSALLQIIKTTPNDDLWKKAAVCGENNNYNIIRFYNNNNRRK